MLLYHFPLTSNSATPNLENKGLKSDSVIGGQVGFAEGGKLSSYAAKISQFSERFELRVNIETTYTICFRTKVTAHWYLCEISNQLFASGNCFTDDLWHDIVIVDRKLYVDGVFKSEYNYSDGLLKLGGKFRETRQASYDGLIQDIRIYDHVLSQQEIKDYSKALVLHYPLNGSELGNVVKDCSGFGNDVTYPSSDYINTYSKDTPRYSQMLVMKSKMQGLSMQSGLSPLKGRTFSIWVKQNKSEIEYSYWNYFYLYSITDGTNGDYAYLADGNGRRLLLVSKNGLSYPFTTGGVYHIAIVYTETQRIVYVNGVVLNRYNFAVGNEMITRIFDGNGGNFSRLDGCKSIVDYRIYASALSESDIKALYNQPISLGNSLNAIELSEPAKYKSFAWRTPTYNEMNYIINQRPNASSLRGLGRVNVNGSYINGCFILPDVFIAPEGVTFTPTTKNYTTNSYILEQFRKLEDVGVVFFSVTGYRAGNVSSLSNGYYYTGTAYYRLRFDSTSILVNDNVVNYHQGHNVRLVRQSQQGKFSTPNGNLDFAPANLQYHCTKHIWRFAENQYDYIGTANANISDTYNGWIDSFGYGTSGKNFSPTLHSTNNADYASGDISGTDNDWGINEITTAEHEEKNIKLYKSGVITANEISEGDTNEFTANSIQVTILKED